MSARWCSILKHQPWNLLLGTVVLSLFAGIADAGGGAWDSVMPTPQRDQGTIVVPIDKSRIIDLGESAARISIANPAIADILIISARQIYLNGKQLGSTNIILWDDADRVQRQIGIEVTHDLQTLKEKLHQFLPKERIEVASAKGAIVLSGEVSSPTRLDAALRLAQSFAGGDEGGVINLLSVGGAQQVLLEVKVAEVQRSFGKQMGIDFLGLYDGGNIEIALLNDVFSGADDVSGAISNLPTTGGVLELLGGNFTGTTVALDIAQSKGLARILAEPNLTTLSGQKAEFLSGGRFPVVQFNEDGVPGTEFFPFGIELSFVPMVLDSDLISLQVNVSVSELGDEVQTPIGPATSTRDRGAKSTVEVPSGQTIAIAGLISETTIGSGTRYPGLGDLPVLGPLFRSQQFQKRQTELVIFVTPRLARPYDSDLVRLPTDDFVDPSDVEFYLQGRLYGNQAPNRSDGSSPSAAPSPGRLGPDKRGSEGPFGHDL